MPKKSKVVERKRRADAERNRQRILEAAREVFTRSGALAGLDEIARLANVGPGTLYRHFPTRDALLEAVFRCEVQKLADAGRKFAESMPPVEALRAWMLLFVDYIAAKQIIAPALQGQMDAKVVKASYAPVHDAVRRLVKRAIESGEVRKDVDAVDLLRALVGVAQFSGSSDWRASARRLVDILIAGSRKT
ncbi:MAG TPA: TetR/AcrR family transcriptional regulator [Bryobacteraceae bacterium]|jgi:AcrR family transcriptional regulator|nr:TetR/AcrR family transcriptional regulator [Bryobacteraceae bacterium]